MLSRRSGRSIERVKLFDKIAPRQLGFDALIAAGTLTLATAVAGLIASVGPARKAARLDVLEAISYE